MNRFLRWLIGETDHEISKEFVPVKDLSEYKRIQDRLVREIRKELTQARADYDRIVNRNPAEGKK